VHANRGQVWVGGKEITANRHEIAQQIGYLPEDPAFYPWMTPGEFLDYVGRVFQIGAKERSDRVKELIKLAGLGSVKRHIGDFPEVCVSALAGGFCSIARKSCFDEPASALTAGRKEVLDF
jgi:ABC-2 type transport system ATP-binding protein